MYTIRILNNQDYDKLPYKFVKDSLGCADAKRGVAFVRSTGIKDFDMLTLSHEIDELVAKQSPHEIDHIRYKGKQPEYNPPSAPTLKTAQQIFDEAVGFAKGQYPLAYGARESGLADLARGMDFYKQFQPTSFEEALGSQYFQNVWPEMERTIKGGLSTAGVAYSPILAEQLGKARGQIGFDVGSYLSNLGQERAQYSLQSRLGIDPQTMTLPYAETNQYQSNEQARYNYEAELAKAQADYQNALAKAKQKQAKISSLTSMAGMGIGLALAPFRGGMSMALPLMSMGGAAGGAISPLFGGGESPISFQDAISMAQIGKASPVNTPKNYDLFSSKIPQSSWRLPNPYAVS